MFQLHDFILTLIAFASEFLGTLSGFGSSTFFVPSASLLEGLHMVLALTAILHCFGNMFRLLIFWRHFQFKIFARFAVPFIILTGAGALLASYFPVTITKLILAILLIVLPVPLFILKHKQHVVSDFWITVFNLLSGFFTGCVGTGGALRGLALSSLNLEKSVFIVTSASIDMGGDLLRASIYLFNNFFDWNHWFYLPLFGGAAFLGTIAAKKVLGYFKQLYFDLMVLVFVFLSGVALLYQHLQG